MTFGIIVRRSRPVDDDRLRGSTHGLGEYLRPRRCRGAARRTGNHLIDVGIGYDRGDYLVVRGESVVVAVGGGIDRIGDRRVRDDQFAQLAGSCFGEFRQFKPVLYAAIGEQHARAARERDNADAVAFRHAPRAKHFHHVDKVVHVAHLDEAAVAERGLEQFVARGHARGMRCRGLAADVGIADFPYEDGLAELERALAEGDQALPVGDAFHEHHHRIVFTALEEELRELEHRNIGFVAGRDRVIEADTIIGRGGDHAETETAGLRDHRARAGDQRLQLHGAAKADARVVVQVQHAQAVGADQAHAAAFCGLYQLFLQCYAVAADFAEARRQHDGERYAVSAALLDDAQHVVRRQRHQRDIAGLGYGGDVLVTGEALDLRVLRIDRIDLALDSRIRSAASAAGRRCATDRWRRRRRRRRAD